MDAVGPTGPRSINDAASSKCGTAGLLNAGRGAKSVCPAATANSRGASSGSNAKGRL
jgi:hypothetical protein